jgi:hypothetical protein
VIRIYKVLNSLPTTYYKLIPHANMNTKRERAREREKERVVGGYEGAREMLTGTDKINNYVYQ